MYSHAVQMAVATPLYMLPVGGTVYIEICKVVN